MNGMDPLKTLFQGVKTRRSAGVGIGTHRPTHGGFSCGHGRQASRFMVSWVGLVVVGLAAWSAGCQRYQVTVSLDEGLRDAGMMPSLEVDLVAVNESELDRWTHYSVNEYFASDDVFRHDADRYTMTFADSDADPKTLVPNDPIWRLWRKKSARQLVVLVHLPGDYQDLPGQQDVRRLILPLSAIKGLPLWPATAIDLVVKKSGVVSLTSLKPQ